MTNQELSRGGPRRRFALGVCLASVLAVLALGGRATAQQGQGKYLTQASERLGKLIGKSNGEGYKLANNKFAIGGGWLKQGPEWVALFTIKLEQGKSYRVIAAGDDDARDVDVQVLDAGGTVVKADTLTDPVAVVDFQPTTTDRYLVRVRVYASRDNVPSLCLGIVMVK